jgi:hypothetical protein
MTLISSNELNIVNAHIVLQGMVERIGLMEILDKEACFAHDGC